MADINDLNKTPTPGMIASRFKPGVSGNPAGRPKGLNAMLRERYRDDIPAFFDAMRDIILGRLPPGLGVESSVRVKDRIAAFNAFMDRYEGKPSVNINHTTEESRRLSELNVDELDEDKLAEAEAFLASLAKPTKPAPAIVVNPGQLIDAESTEKP